MSLFQAERPACTQCANAPERKRFGMLRGEIEYSEWQRRQRNCLNALEG